MSFKSRLALFSRTSSADGEASPQCGPAAGERPAGPELRALSSAGQPSLTKTDLAAASFAVREYSAQRRTDFGRHYWTTIADKLAQARDGRSPDSPPDACYCGGRIRWVNRGDCFDGWCQACYQAYRADHVRPKQQPARTSAELIETVDLLEQENEALHAVNARLRGELDVARSQRDTARAIDSGMAP